MDRLLTKCFLANNWLIHQLFTVILACMKKKWSMGVRHSNAHLFRDLSEGRQRLKVIAVVPGPYHVRHMRKNMGKEKQQMASAGVHVGIKETTHL